MEISKSPFPPAGEVPLHRNPPLAPSQELAYRNKCISLKKRLQDIETNNDSTRKRIKTETERVQKQRLLRSILLHQLREIMETPGRRFRPEELERMGIPLDGNPEDDDLHRRGRPDGEVLLDDSSDDSEEDIPEPSDRPTRTRRQNNYRGESVMNPNAAPATYQQPNLLAIAPANPAYSPTAGRESLLTSSFQTPGAGIGGSPQQHSHQQQQYVQDPRYPPVSSSPVIVPGVHHPQVTSRPTSVSQPVQALGTANPASEPNGYRAPATSSVPQPERPSAPYNQFCDHMRPQLEADNYPRQHIQNRIDEEWRKLSDENRSLWNERYHEQMRDYEEQMDQWKRTHRVSGGTGSFRGR